MHGSFERACVCIRAHLYVRVCEWACACVRVCVLYECVRAFAFNMVYGYAFEKIYPSSITSSRMRDTAHYHGHYIRSNRWAN